MNALMCLEIYTMVEGLIALSAHKGLCASVSELMCLEIIKSVKGLIALSALERPLCGNTIV